MSDPRNNPIPFNPDTMTVAELKACAETMRTLYDVYNRGLENCVPQLEAAQDVYRFVCISLARHKE